RLRDEARAVLAALLDAPLALPRPAPADVLGGQVDDGVHALQRGRVDGARRGVPARGAGGVWRAGDGDHPVAVALQGAREGAADEAGGAGDGHRPRGLVGWHGPQGLRRGSSRRSWRKTSTIMSTPPAAAPTKKSIARPG